MISNLLRSSSSVSVLCITISVVILGTDIFYQNIQPTTSLPPIKLRPGQVEQQMIALGSEQRMVLQIQSSYLLRITIVDSNSLEAYLKTPVAQLTLFDDSTTSFDIKLKTSNYAVICIFWNNSIIQEHEGNHIIEENHISARLSIIGIDFDILKLSIIFIVLGVLIELFNRFRISFGYNIMNKLYSYYQSTNKLTYLGKRRQNSPTLIFRYPILAVFKKEQARSPRSLFIVLLVVTFFIVNPPKKLLLVNPSNSDLTFALIDIWYESFQELWIFWTIILALMGIMIWKLKIDSNELSYDFSLPINRSVYAFVLFILIIIDSIIVLIFPLFASVVIIYFRFNQIADLYVISAILLWFITYMIIILLISVTMGVLFPYSRLYNVIIYFLIFISSITIVNDLFFKDIIFPLPSGLKWLVNHIKSASLTNYDILVFMFSTVLSFLGIFRIYLYSIQSIEIK